LSNYAHSRRPWRGSADRQPEGPCTPSDLSPRIYAAKGGRPFRTRLRQHLLQRRLQHGRSCHFLGIRETYGESASRRRAGWRPTRMAPCTSRRLAHSRTHAAAQAEESRAGRRGVAPPSHGAEL